MELGTVLSERTAIHLAKRFQFTGQNFYVFHKKKIMDGCNECICLNSGFYAHCKKMNRDKNSYPDAKDHKSAAIKLSQNKNITTTTTKKPSMKIKVVTVEEIMDENFTCKPFEAFKLECNTCWCAQNRKEPRDCTRIACNPKEYAPLPK
jgi:hypothetical protein